MQDSILVVQAKRLGEYCRQNALNNHSNKSTERKRSIVFHMCDIRNLPANVDARVCGIGTILTFPLIIRQIEKRCFHDFLLM